MRRRRFLLAAGAAALGGCSSGGGTDAGANDPATERPSEGSPGTPSTTGSTTTGADRAAIEAARNHLAVAFDELREMRPVGPEYVRASEARFRASDHAVVDERVAAATAALDGASANGRTADGVVRLRAAVDLARAGRSLYAAFRRTYRGEWWFEAHCYRARWAEAREAAERAHRGAESWQPHARAVTAAVETLGTTDPTPVPRLSTSAWYRDGSVLAEISVPLVDRLGGFEAFADAVRHDETGLEAMRAGEYRAAEKAFASAAEAVGGAHRRLVRAAEDGAQAFASYALPIRGRCGPFRTAYLAQADAAAAAASGDFDRAEELEGRAMDRILAAELAHRLPRPETATGGSSGAESG